MPSRRILCPLTLAALCAPAPTRADVLVPRGDAVLIRQSNGTEVQLTVRAILATRSEPEPSSHPVTEALPTPPSAAPPPSTPAAPPVPLWVSQPTAQRISDFRPDGNQFVSGAKGTGVDLALRLSWESGAGFTLQATTRAQQPVWARLLALEIEADADGASALGRDLRPVALQESPLVLSRFDPKWVTLYRRGRPVLTLVLDDEADGLQLRRVNGRVRLRVDLFTVEARPFYHFTACTDNWKDPNQRLALPTRLLEKDETHGARLSLYPAGALPLLKGRYPDGRRAALVITDHADQTAARTLRALAGGTSDQSDPRWGQTGLLGHGLAITKALWLRSGERLGPMRRGPAGPAEPLERDQAPPMVGRRPTRPPLAALAAESELELINEGMQADENGGGRPQLDDPQVVALADRLYAAGWEIIPHSATPMRDEREQTREALAYFRRYAARSWIDHQPYTNCEALLNQGYLPGRYGITDLLAQHGYRYAWSGIDVPPGDLNLLGPRRLDRYVPVLWPVGRLAGGTPDTLWLFRSMLAFIETQRFFDVYNNDTLDRLERERGLHISHTYLENLHPPRSWFGKRNLMVPGRRAREVVPDPRLEALFSSMAARVARGTLWVPTLSHLGDHMQSVASVAVSLEPDGSAVLQSRRALSGVTFVVPRPHLQVRVDGRAPRGTRGGDSETSFWLNLPADHPVRVQLLSPGGQAISFLAPPPPPGATPAPAAPPPTVIGALQRSR